MNITQAIARQAQIRGDAPALIGEGVVLSHAALESAVGRTAAALVKQGIAPGDVVGISMQTSPLHLLVILALARAGAVSVHVHPEHFKGAKEAVVRRYGVAVAVVDADQPAPNGCTLLAADPSWLEPAAAVQGPAAAGGDMPWRISLSSGTTGTQKGVLRTHAGTMTYLELYASAVPVDARGRFLCHRGLDAQLALYPSLLHLLVGAAVVFPGSRGFESFIETIDRHAVTEIVMSPAFLRDLLIKLPPGPVRFPGLTHLLVGGSAMPPPLIEEALARVTPNLHVGYGVSEAGRLAIADPGTLRRSPHSVGRVVHWIKAEAVDGEDRPVPPGTPGILRFHGAVLPCAYYRNPRATAKSFRGRWFYPGDTGRLDPDGLLFIESRVDDRINLGGVKVDPFEVERVLVQHPAVEEAVAFGASIEEGRTDLFAAVRTRSAVDERVLLEHCRARLGRRYAPLRVFFVRELPRNEAGKLLRRELSRRLKIRTKKGTE